MPRAIDRQGQRFGRLVVIARDITKQDTGWWWWCQCDCGVRISVRSFSLGKHTHSCGCFRKDVTRARSTTHGLTKSRRVPPEFIVWRNARERCFEPTDKQFLSYGGRGITMCDRWRNDYGAFYADMGPRPHGYTLDRIDNDGHYEPGNCRWTTPSVQSNNTRRNRWLLLRGERLTLAQAARKYKIKHQTVQTRLSRGWTDEDAVLGRARSR